MKIIEILRLTGMGLSQRQIAQSAGCARSTVGEVLSRCRENGLDYDSAKTLTDEQLQTLLYPDSGANRPKKPEPDWKYVHNELVKHRNLNLQFMWEEYRQQTPDGLGYSRFCEKYRCYRKQSGRPVSLHQERAAGEEMEVDWMGDVLPCVINTETGEIADAHFFVAVLGNSGMPYVEAFPDEKQMSWIQAHVNALQYYGGVPRIIIPDNCKTAVKSPKYYEPVINSAYWELAEHYEVAVIPARARKPRDKPAVEQSVGWLETWLLGKLRNQRFFSFAELNRMVRRYILELSKRPYQNREGSRYSIFHELDRPALRPLPRQRFEVAEIVARRVPDNYHVEYDGFYYSVPFTLHGQMVSLRATATVIEILDKNHIRVASHVRKTNGKRYVSDTLHMPPHHLAVHESRQYDGGRYRSWAKNIGENTYHVIDGLLNSYKIEEQAYKSCMGILQFSKKYDSTRLEAACTKARLLNALSYTTVRNILKNGLDGSASGMAKPTPEHENIRGRGYYV